MWKIKYLSFWKKLWCIYLDYGDEIMTDKNTKGETLIKVVNCADKASQGFSAAGTILGAIVVVASLFKR